MRQPAVLRASERGPGVDDRHAPMPATRQQCGRPAAQPAGLRLEAPGREVVFLQIDQQQDWFHARCAASA